MAGEIAATVLKPFFLGRDPLYREKHWHDFRMVNRWWNHIPDLFVTVRFDIGCWLIGALAAGATALPIPGGLSRIGFQSVASSLVLATPGVAQQALEVQARGWMACESSAGDVAFDLQAYTDAEAVGDGFTLMADPVAAYTHDQAMRVRPSWSSLATTGWRSRCSMSISMGCGS